MEKWTERPLATEEAVRDWWTRNPNNNVGRVCTATDFVLDVDPRHDGDKSLALLEETHGKLPVTRRVDTSSGSMSPV